MNFLNFKFISKLIVIFFIFLIKKNYLSSLSAVKLQNGLSFELIFFQQMTDDCMHAIDDHQRYFELEMVSDCWLFVRLQVN